MPAAPGFEIILYHGAGSYTITNASNQRVLSRKYEKDENFPAKLTFTLDNGRTDANYNLLNTACSAWTGGVTGALTIGDSITYSVYPTSTGIKTMVFSGFIRKLNPKKRTLTVEAVDWLGQYEEIKQDRIFYANYRDVFNKNQVYDAATNKWTITTPGGGTAFDATLVAPLVSLNMGTNTKEKVCGGAHGTDSIPVSATDYVAQVFIAETDYIKGIRFWYKCAAGMGTLKWGIYELDATGYPTGGALYTGTYPFALAAAYAEVFQWVMDASLNITGCWLVPGRKYAVLFYALAGNTPIIGLDTAPAEEPYDSEQKLAAVWSVVATHPVDMRIIFCEHVEIPSSDYTWDPAGLQITINKPPSGLSSDVVSNWFSDEGAYCYVSYYYGSLAASSVLAYLRLLENVNHTAMAWNAGIDIKTFPLYRTNGRSALECMREILDGYCCEVGAAWYQGTVTPLTSSTSLYFGRRKTTAFDAAEFTFSTTGAVDGALRIIDYNLTLDGRKPNTIVVVGTDATGNAIVTQVDDRTMGTSSFRTKSHLTTTERVQDNGINTLDLADDVAMAAYERMTRDVWEGDVTIDGIYPNMFNMVWDDDTQGSGAIISLNVPELGIVTTKFKVTGIVMSETRTIIKLSNIDVLLDNKVNMVSKKAERLESTTGPTDLYNQYFMAVSESTVGVTDAVAYMELQTAAGAALPGQTRVLCNLRSMPHLKQSRYQATFEVGNAYTVDGVSLIGKIVLYLNITGLPSLAAVVLTSGYQVPKWTTTRVIVEFMCWDAT